MDQTFYKKLAGLMFPIVFQNLMLASVAVADAIMLGSVEGQSQSWHLWDAYFFRNI